MNSIPRKVCSICKQEFPATTEFFYAAKTYKYGVSSRCKICHNAYTQQYYEANKSAIRLTNNQWAKQHPEIVKATKKRYADTHKEQVAEKNTRYREEHPGKYKARMAVQNAVEYGRLPHVTSQQCKYCSEKAQCYHHWSYRPEHWLDVIPLCFSCHNRLHTGNL